jgi:ATP-dependent DNA ligase
MGDPRTRRDRETVTTPEERLEGVSRVESTGAPEPGPGPIDPMLATTFEGTLEAVDEGVFVAERKYDVTRLILEKFDGEVSLYTRRHIERSETLRELTATATLPDGRIVGYTPCEGRRADTFGALVMMDAAGYVGRVGSGFTDAELESILEEMTPTAGRPVSPTLVGKPYTPVEPFVGEVKYQAVTESGELRAPVFVRSRPDKPVEDVTEINE